MGKHDSGVTKDTKTSSTSKGGDHRSGQVKGGKNLEELPGEQHGDVLPGN